MTDTSTITLRPDEIQAVLESPAAIQAVMDYWDRQICMGEAMDYPCQFEHSRYAELKALKEQREALEKEWAS